MVAAAVTRHVQRLLLVPLAFLLAWQVAVLAGVPRHVQVVRGLHGFVFHVLLTRACSLVRSYFTWGPAVARAPALQLPVSILGAVGLAAAGLGAPAVVGTAGAVLWFAGAMALVGALAWTVRGDPTGAETGTGEAKADRRSVDRSANAFVPAVAAYLLAGAYDLLAARVGLPTVAGCGPRSPHPPGLPRVTDRGRHLHPLPTGCRVVPGRG